MIEKTSAIPLAIHPYSSRSQIIHWFTLHHGLISTLLKSSLHPKSIFLGEYQLFGTTELIYDSRSDERLNIAKECYLLKKRNEYRNNWRAMQIASYLTSIFKKILPYEAPAPQLFYHLELLLDYTIDLYAQPLYLPWSELSILKTEGNYPAIEAVSNDLKILVEILINSESPYNLPNENIDIVIINSLNKLTGTFIRNTYELPMIHRKAMQL